MKKIILGLCCGLSIGGMKAQTATFNYTGTLQTWTVPCGVSSITVEALGAQGGSSGGFGAKIQGTFTCAPAEILDILVGGAGTSNGGGGGTFIVAPGNTPLAIAGGGGGGTNNVNTEGQITGTADDGTTTGSYSGTFAGKGGSGGGGGGAGSASDNSTSGGAGGVGCTVGGNTNGGSSNCGAGGGGFCGNGGNSSGNSATGGMSYQNAGAGGTTGGGYGGGGGGFSGYGGGGGYSGGGGGAWSSSWATAWGGGGGSFNGGTSPVNAAGFQTGNGQVIITWVLPAALSVTATAVSNVSCHGGSNASANAVVTGGGSPYTYLWTPSAQTNVTATGLSAGTYTIGVSDACGHTASASVAITQPLVLAATATTSTNVTCHGGSTGATASTVTGGSTPYTYSWTGGSTNATATGLTAGSYTLTVRDLNGCSATASTVVTQPNALVIDTTFTTANVLCNSGNTGSAKTVVSGGSSPYTYLWTPGGGSTDSAVGLSAGTYTLMVSDACGASATASATITQPTAIGITSVSTPDNGTTNGTIALTVSGGNSPYMYVWTPSGKTTATISSESAGTYKCIVTDANGCKDSVSVKIKSIAGINGISDNSAQIVVYPNPNNGLFTIESSVGGASSVEIYNILGEKVYTRNLSTTKGTNTINVGNQPNGVYLYRIISDSGDLLGEGRISIQK